MGVALGTVVSLMLSRVLVSQLYGVTPTDPVTFASAITARVPRKRKKRMDDASQRK